MIHFIQQIAVGNALRIFVTPPEGAQRWRVLRRTSDEFSGQDDADAVLVHDGSDEAFVDHDGLANGTEYFYRLWWFDGDQWIDGNALTATPGVTLRDESVDVVVLLRDRLAAGFAVEIAAGRLTHDDGVIGCRNAPAREEDTILPVVTIQLSEDKPAMRAIGESLAPDSRIDDGYLEYEGWYSDVSVEVVAWSFNPDERIILRQALKRIVLGNLGLFEAEGLRQVEFSVRDAEDYEAFNAPVYQAWGTFRCQAPSLVAGEVGEITDVITELTWGPP